MDKGLAELAPAFEEMYSETGRRSIPPEQLLRALRLQIFFSIRSERLLVERIDYDLLFCWFVGLGIDDWVWNHSTFSKNRDRLMSGNVDELLFEAIKKQAYARKLMSRDHFSVDGTLLEACASLKSFRPRDDSDDDNGENFGRHALDPADPTRPDGRCGQGLRCWLIYHLMSRSWRHATRGIESKTQPYRRAHDAPCGLSNQPEEAQTRRGTGLAG